jgi:beta-galactosidase
VDKYEFVSWKVPYAPGKLEAVGKKNGREVSRCLVETTGSAVALELVPDRAALLGDGWDALPVTVRAVDAQGRIVPTASPLVEFELAGPGAIIGLGNGDPNCHEPEKGTRHSIFNGLGQVILQSQPGGTGQLTLRAKSAGLKTAETVIVIIPVVPRPAVAVEHPPMNLQSWRMSPVAATAPDPNQQIADNDMNSWSPVEAGKLQIFSGGNFAVYRIRFEPNAGVQANGGRLVFKSLTGKAEVWLDGKNLGRKTNYDAAPLTLPIPAAGGIRTLSVLIETSAGQPAGFGKLVAVENN